MNRTEALRLVASARVARLATVSEQGEPHLVPIVFALAGEYLVSTIDHKPKRSRDLKRLENIASNPRVSLLVDHYSDAWDRLWWVRIDGRARVVESGEEFERALDALAAKYEQYRQVRPAGPVIRVGLERVVGWRAADPAPED